MEAVLVTVAIPPRSLSPNARVHWSIFSKAKKKTRIDTWAQCQIAMHEQGVKGNWKHCECRVVWYARCKRRRDKDNLLASLIPVFNGLVDGGLLVDDEGLTHLPMRVEVDTRNPRIELHLRQTDGKKETGN